MSGNLLAARIVCSRCNGNGWVKPFDYKLDDWVGICPACDGRSTFSVRELAQATGESSTTIRRFINGRSMRVRTYLRLLDKLLKLA